MNKSTYIVSLFVAVLVGVVVGYSLTHKEALTAGTSSPSGSTNTTAKIYSVVMSPATGSATSTTFQNPTAGDWAIESSFAVCDGVGTSKTAYTGTGLANLLLQGATSSVASPTSLGNSNYGTNLVVGTSTTDGYAATSTEGVIQGTSRLIPSLGYYSLFFNATNTASCTVGIHYLQK